MAAVRSIKSAQQETHRGLNPFSLRNTKLRDLLRKVGGFEDGDRTHSKSETSSATHFHCSGESLVRSSSCRAASARDTR